MCGLVGIAGHLELKDEDTMKRLFMLDWFRGEHSTGFAAVRNDGKTHLAKEVGAPPVLFDTSRFKTAMNGSQSRAFIGHNRLATRGEVTAPNAHPYEFDHIIGAHNGTIETKDKWALEDAVGEKFEVDSQAIFAGIAQLGIEGVMEILTEGKTSSTGAWALTWYDKEQGSLNFLRNQHRPLWYGVSEDFKKLFWASQWPMIDAATTLTGGYKMFVDKENYKWFQFEDDMHYRFDLNVLREGKELPIPKAKVKLLKGKEPKSVASSGSGDPFGREQNSGYGHATHISSHKSWKKKGTGSQSNSQDKRSEQKPAFLPMVGTLLEPFAGWIRCEEWEDYAFAGCSYCFAELPWGSTGVTVYQRNKLVLCRNCSGHHEDEDRPTNRVHVSGAEMDALV